MFRFMCSAVIVHGSIDIWVELKHHRVPIVIGTPNQSGVGWNVQTKMVRSGVIKTTR